MASSAASVVDDRAGDVTVAAGAKALPKQSKENRKISQAIYHLKRKKDRTPAQEAELAALSAKLRRYNTKQLMRENLDMTAQIDATTSRIEEKQDDIIQGQADAKARDAGVVPLMLGGSEDEELNVVMTSIRKLQNRANILRKNKQDKRDARQDDREQRQEQRLKKQLELATTQHVSSGASSSAEDPKLTKAVKDQAAFETKRAAAATKRAASAAKRQAAVDKVAEPVVKDAAERPKASKRRARRNPADGVAEPNAAVESNDDGVEQPQVDAEPSAPTSAANEAKDTAVDVSAKSKAQAVKARTRAKAKLQCLCGKTFEIAPALHGHKSSCVIWKERPKGNEPEPKRARRATASAADVKDAPEEKCEECGSNDCVMTIVVGDVTKQLCQVCQKKRDEAMAAEAAPPKVISNKSGFKGKTLGVDFDIADFAFQDER